MAEKMPQTFANHSRLVPGYHVVAGLLLLLNVGFAGWTLIRDFSFGNIVFFTTAVALLLIGFYARAFALAVQDRVIRLEERLRLRTILPTDLQPRIEELTTEQLIALRFASDGEVPDLTRKVLDENIGDRAAIKKLIKNWRPDYCRA